MLWLWNVLCLSMLCIVMCDILFQLFSMCLQWLLFLIYSFVPHQRGAIPGNLLFFLFIDSQFWFPTFCILSFALRLLVYILLILPGWVHLFGICVGRCNPDWYKYLLSVGDLLSQWLSDLVTLVILCDIMWFILYAFLSLVNVLEYSISASTEVLDPSKYTVSSRISNKFYHTWILI